MLVYTWPVGWEVFEEALEQLREAIGILQVEPDGKEELQEQMKNLSRILTDLDEECGLWTEAPWSTVVLPLILECQDGKLSSKIAITFNTNPQK